MSPDSYVYCPFCGTELIWRELFQRRRPTCPACGFIQFHDPKVAVIGLVVSAGHVLLVRRAVAPAKGRWALPGGYMDAGEMPDVALQRELQEETGLVVEVQALLQVFPMENQGSAPAGIVLAYRAAPAQSETLPDPHALDDVSDAAWFGATELPKDLAFESTVHLLSQWKANEKNT